ncbi:MAG: gliding motility protein GldM [Bacteroidetes bacterium]|nr:MAG: gliding motility protein GldM [Bacteroidota bacterium]
MAGGKQTPRQRLINLMYLVLTAMLALQVSSSIMDKFIFLNQSLEHSMEAARDASEAALVALKKKVDKEGNSPEGQQSIKRAEELKRETSKIIGEIEKIKKDLFTQVGGGPDPHTGAVKNAKEETGVETMMIGVNRNGKGYDLKRKLDAYVSYLNDKFKDLFDGNAKRFEMLAKGNADIQMYKHDPLQRDKDFAQANFGQTPVVAALAILTQRQSEVIRYEQEVLKKLGAGDLSRDVKFDQIIAMASADANVVAAGQDYTAQLFISATSSQSGARMTYNGNTIKVDSKGVGEVKFQASGTGKQKWTGTITFKSRGKDTTFKIEKEYEVVQPVMIVVSESKFPLYRNCANPLETSVPALGPAYKPAFSVNNGTAVPGAKLGTVTLYPTTLGDCKLSVSSSGKNVGDAVFRVNPVPPPSVFLGNSTGGEVNIKNPIPPVAGLRIVAKPDETFLNTLPKEAQYRVTGVTCTVFRGGKSVNSVKSSDGGINLAALSTRPGDAVQLTIDNVQRINSRGQIEEVKVSQPYISFFLK